MTTTRTPEGVQVVRARVVLNGWLLGRVERIGSQWRVAASAYAFTTNGQTANQVPVELYRPKAPDIWLPGVYTTRREAVATLTKYLRKHRAPALGFGPHRKVK